MNQDMDLVRADMAANNARPLSFEGHSPQANRQESSLSEVGRLFRGRYLLAVILSIIGLVGGGALGWYAAPVPTYESVGYIQIASHLQPLLYDEVSNQNRANHNSYLAEQALKLRSQQVVDAAIISSDWKSTGRAVDEEAVEDFRENLMATTGIGEIIQVTFLDSDPKVVTIAVKSVINAYESIYAVKDVNASEATRKKLETLRQTYASNLETLTEDIINFADRYGSESIESLFERKLNSMEELKSKMVDTQLLLSLEGQEVVADPTAPVDDTELAEGEEEEPVDLLQVEIDKTAHYTSEELAEMDDKLGALIKQLESLEFDASINDQSYGALHRATLASQQLVKGVAIQITQRTEWVRSKRLKSLLAIQDGSAAELPNSTPIYNPVIELQQDLQVYQRQYAVLDAELKDMSTRRQKIASRKKVQEETKVRLLLIENRLHEIGVESVASGAGRIDVLSYGERPLLKEDARYTLAALGGFAGTGLGFGIVLLVGFMDQRFNSPIDARFILGHTKLMGFLPSLPDDLSEPVQASMASHAVHHIRSLMQIDLERANGCVTLITSPESQDGKTSLALALGLSFAESGAKTLLVDCDLVGGGLTTRARSIVRRKIGRILEQEGLVTHEQLAEALLLANSSGRKLGEVLIELNYISEDQIDQALVAQENNTVGLMDALAGESLDACIADTGVPNLRILPVGSAEAQHASKLSPLRLRRLLDIAREDFDIVLIDTGPLGGSLEASVIAAEVDAVLIVASRGVHRTQINRMLDQLNTLGAWVMGVVFNRVDQQDFNRYTTSMSTGTSMGAMSRRDQGPAAASTPRYGPIAHAVSDKGPYSTGSHDD